jgi:pimeloyl-ACP methyl ester carboxylesterase
LRLHYLEAGQGPPIVLLHGASGGAANWFRVMAPLAQTHRVLALDLPGFGLSQALQPRAPLGKQLAEILESWLAQLNVPEATVAATSFGGLPALRLAQRAPQRVNGLVLLDSVGLGRELSWAARLASIRLLGGLATRPSQRSVNWQMRTLMLAHIERLPRAQVAALSAYLYESARATDWRRLARGFHDFATLRGQREVLNDEELRSLPQRVMIGWGALDRFVPVQHARRAAALVPGAQLRIIPDVGHSPNWEAPGAVAEIISEFLRQQARPSPS